ncbi:UDP-glucose:polyglycerol phosphate glucosyltransferase [Fictibacillus macauensis ZFHKF-1]|uniref:UDP-glucose:polyglycerol phosphate glucosyltransferase n=1 Tax=Fictibacillus macauensis ZFHKF-1 TaxID=1196324 RepID=I8IWJ2_9BACL|nr:glycosyltransferase [Fictibacillus macauensis]EIT83871.1 UDP-glucose:polyglycerol phosphate glucosyltransferase [Fictibacillus macauensis ZFHKF-1]
MKRNETIFCMLNSLELQRGGMTKAAMMQASMFAELGYETFLISFKFNPHHTKIVQQLKQSGKLHRDVTVRSMYDELERASERDGGFREPKEIAIVQAMKENKRIVEAIPAKRSYRVFEEGVGKTYIRYADNEEDVLFIDHFIEGRYRTKREYYDEYGYVKRTTYMDYVTNKGRELVYQNKEGKPFLTKWINKETDEADKIYWFGEQNIQQVFKSDLDLKKHWLQSLISKYKNPVLLCDARAADPVLVNVAYEGAVKIWRLHSHHLQKEVPKTVFPKVKPTLDVIDTLDAALFLTAQQKNDVEALLGKPLPNASVIGNFIESPSPIVSDKDPNLAVIIGRFASGKRLDHAIKAFSLIVRDVPRARLELWGYGEEEKALKQLIKKEGLTEHVTIKGFTSDPQTIYQKALFSILASKSEGFPLSILESMGNGTPVVSYDIQYGPAEMMTDETGILVPNGDIKALAAAMKEMYSRPEKAMAFGERAAERVRTMYSREQHVEAWEQIIQTAVARKNKAFHS